MLKEINLGVKKETGRFVLPGYRRKTGVISVRRTVWGPRLDAGSLPAAVPAEEA